MDEGFDPTANGEDDKDSSVAAERRCIGRWEVDTTFEDTAGEEANLEKKGCEKYDRGSNPKGWIRSGKHTCKLHVTITVVHFI